MHGKSNLALEDTVLSVKAFFFGMFDMDLAQRAALEKLLEVRRQRFAPDHPALAAVFEDLAKTYLGYAADDLNQADQLAQEAERILLLVGKRGKYTFRIGKLIHLRCQIQQRLSNPYEALQLGEEALDLYNNTKLLCYERSSLMHTLVHLHKQVGSAERAQQLAIEVRAIDGALMSMSSRRRF